MTESAWFAEVQNDNISEIVSNSIPETTGYRQPGLLLIFKVSFHTILAAILDSLKTKQFLAESILQFL